MNRYFETLEDYNTYTENGTRLTAGDLYFIKDVKMILKTNNFDGTMQTYEMSVSGGGDKEEFNIINYTATEQLVAGASGSGSGSGGGNTFDKNGFQDENGQPLTITSHTFENGVGRIEFNDDIVKIGDNAFEECTSLTSIVIPDSVTSIGEGAFNNCHGLKSITIPDSVTSIGKEAFYYCSGLTSITIGNGVTSIGNSAFEGCTMLDSMTVEATTPPTLGSDVFVDVYCQFYVPAASVDAYKAAAGWSSYASDIQAIPTE